MIKKLSLREMIGLARQVDTWQRTQQQTKEIFGTDAAIGDRVWCGNRHYTEYTGEVHQLKLVSSKEVSPDNFGQKCVYSLRCTSEKDILGEEVSYGISDSGTKEIYDYVHSRVLKAEEEQENAEKKRADDELRKKLKQARMLLGR